MVDKLAGIPSLLTKNLLLKDKKAGIFLVTVKADRAVDMKKLPELLGIASNANLRFTDCDAVLGVSKGSVSPYAVLNDTAGVVTAVLDSALVAAGVRVCTHPLRCDRSVEVASSDLLAFMRAVGHDPKIVDFPEHNGPASASSASSSRSQPTTTTKPAAANNNDNDEKKKPQQRQASSATTSARNKKGTKETLDRIVSTKQGDFATWFSEVITKSEMIEYGKVSGCYILRPWSFGIWEQMQAWFDAEIKELDVENAYFPLFVTKGALEAEESHVEGFAPEVAWVTKSGDSDLPEPIAVRPTSETIMYPEFAKWLRSHRDLPLKLNQWCSVVRWEFKYPTPFLRSREFLWQEGHTAHYGKDEADEMVASILDLYVQVYQDLLAVPVIAGTKTEKEKFAGGFSTSTVEAYVAGSGRAIQGATSHNLGQNFGKIYGIAVEDKDASKDRVIPWQTSWGLTTRAIGVMVMVHSDDQGLVLPPRVSPLHVVVVPLVYKTCTLEDLKPFVDDVVKELKKKTNEDDPYSKLRVKVDDRSNYSPGWKYNHWEQKGVPLRFEIGPRDLEQKAVTCVRRVDGQKCTIALADISKTARTLLADAQATMLAKAQTERDAKVVRVTQWNDFVPALDDNNLVLTPWCDPADQQAEEAVKEQSRAEALRLAGLDAEDARTATSLAAKTLCVPHDQPTALPDGSTKCFFTGKPASCWCLWGRSY